MECWLARSRYSASAALTFLKVLLEEPSFQILCLLGATPPAFPSRTLHLEKERERRQAHTWILLELLRRIRGRKTHSSHMDSSKAL